MYASLSVSEESSETNYTNRRRCMDSAKSRAYKILFGTLNLMSDVPCSLRFIFERYLLDVYKTCHFMHSSERFFCRPSSARVLDPITDIIQGYPPDCIILINLQYLTFKDHEGTARSGTPRSTARRHQGWQGISVLYSYCGHNVSTYRASGLPQMGSRWNRADLNREESMITLARCSVKTKELVKHLLRCSNSC